MIIMRQTEQKALDYLKSNPIVAEFIEKLNEIDTENVEPLIFMSEGENILHDVVKQTMTHKEALKNAPSKDSDYFRVPKFIDK